MNAETRDDYLEWVVEQKFVTTMEDAGWDCFKLDKLKRGRPDQLCIGPDKVIIVEFKKYGARPRKGEKLQKHYRDKYEEWGHDVRLVTGMEEMWELVEELLGEIPE